MPPPITPVFVPVDGRGIEAADHNVEVGPVSFEISHAR
jgi:hypothetical protein